MEAAHVLDDLGRTGDPPDAQVGQAVHLGEGAGHDEPVGHGRQ